VADLVAQIPGACQGLWGSYIAYTVSAKCNMLGLEEGFISKYGAVSREVACAMAKGALKQSGADIALAVTGLAGPDGDGTSVPLGTVWISTVLRGEEARGTVFHYVGSRNEVRRCAAEDAIQELLNRFS
jgi:PncC family amidohydrolase